MNTPNRDMIRGIILEYRHQDYVYTTEDKKLVISNHARLRIILRSIWKLRESVINDNNKDNI